jgi:acetaldehyde dehydrogenase (acetylating)
MAEEICGKTIVIDRPSYAIYTVFSDLRNLVAAIPEDKKDMVTADADSISAKVQGFEIGMRVHQRTPFSRIDFEQNGQAPFPFLFSMIMDPMDDNRTYFHIEFRAELNTMMKMFIGNRLQELVDKLTDGIAKAASGEMPEGFSSFDVSR